MKRQIVKKIVSIFLIAVITAAAIFVFCWRNTDIPKLYFEGDISEMHTKEDIRDIAVTYVDEDTQFTGYAALKVQGSSSLSYVKKNYTIKFYEDEAHDMKMPVDMGWGAQNEYCLKANWIDRTHARNVVTAKLVSQIQDQYGILTEAPCNGAIDGFPVEIYCNGKFHGLYTFNIPKADWQFGMDDDHPTHLVVSGDGYEPANKFEAEPDFVTWEIEVGQDSEENLANLRALFDFVMKSTDEEFKTKFTEHMDLDSALNYYIMVDVAYLNDNRAKNMLLATYDGVKWYPSLYDLDTSWGTDWDGLSLLPYEESLPYMELSNLHRRIEACFSAELAQRYFELREELLTKEHIMDEFESFRDQIPAMTFLKETVTWGVGVIKTPSDLPGYGYDQIEGYLDSVMGRLDEKYSAMLEK